MTSEGPTDGARVASGLVNTLDTMAREPDFLQGVDRLERFLRWAGLEARPGLTERDVREVKALRSRLRKVFLAETLDEQVELLNGELLRIRPIPQLARTEATWLVAHRPRSHRLVDELATTAVLGLTDVISSYGEGRLAMCEAEPCECVYVDRTRSGRRRYCCRLCNDRASQAAHRRRRGGTTAAG